MKKLFPGSLRLSHGCPLVRWRRHLRGGCPVLGHDQHRLLLPCRCWGGKDQNQLPGAYFFEDPEIDCVRVGWTDFQRVSLFRQSVMGRRQLCESISEGMQFSFGWGLNCTVGWTSIFIVISVRRTQSTMIKKHRKLDCHWIPLKGAYRSAGRQDILQASSQARSSKVRQHQARENGGNDYIFCNVFSNCLLIYHTLVAFCVTAVSSFHKSWIAFQLSALFKKRAAYAKTNKAEISR